MAGGAMGGEGGDGGKGGESTCPMECRSSRPCKLGNSCCCRSSRSAINRNTNRSARSYSTQPTKKIEALRYYVLQVQHWNTGTSYPYRYRYRVDGWLIFVSRLTLTELINYR